MLIQASTTNAMTPDFIDIVNFTWLRGDVPRRPYHEKGGGIGKVVSFGNTGLNIKHMQCKTGLDQVFLRVRVPF